MNEEKVEKVKGKQIRKEQFWLRKDVQKREIVDEKIGRNGDKVG